MIRMYEAYGKRTRTQVVIPSLSGKHLWECGCLENRIRELAHRAGRAEIQIKPYGIYTLRIC